MGSQQLTVVIVLSILSLGALYVIYQITKSFVYIILHVDKRNRKPAVKIIEATKKVNKHKQYDYWNDPSLDYVQMPNGDVRID